MFSTTTSKTSPSVAQYSSTRHGTLVWKCSFTRSSPSRNEQAVAGDVVLYVVVYDVLVEVLALEQKLGVVFVFHG